MKLHNLPHVNYNRREIGTDCNILEEEKMRNKKTIIALVVVLLVSGIYFFNHYLGNEYAEYRDAKYELNQYENYNGDFPEEDNYHLQEAYRDFKDANGFWDTEDYMQKIEAEMYKYLKEHANDDNYANQFYWYILELKNVKKYADEVAVWDKKADKNLEDLNNKILEKYDNKPPYVGMSAEYIFDTSWGDPDTAYKAPLFDANGLTTYQWVFTDVGGARILRSAIVDTDENIVIDVTEYALE